MWYRELQSYQPTSLQDERRTGTVTSASVQHVRTEPILGNTDRSAMRSPVRPVWASTSALCGGGHRYHLYTLDEEKNGYVARDQLLYAL